MAECGGEILCQKDAFLCAALGTSIGIAFSKKLGAGFFGGEGFILQRLQGDGMAFLHAGGMVVKKELVNDVIRVDTGFVELGDGFARVGEFLFVDVVVALFEIFEPFVVRSQSFNIRLRASRLLPDT